MSHVNAYPNFSSRQQMAVRGSSGHVDEQDVAFFGLGSTISKVVYVLEKGAVGWLNWSQIIDYSFVLYLSQ